MLLVHITGIKEPLHLPVSTIQQLVGVIYGIGLVLSCQKQEDLSLYYNKMKCV